jgi:hypothetical protein
MRGVFLLTIYLQKRYVGARPLSSLALVSSIHTGELPESQHLRRRQTKLSASPFSISPSAFFIISDIRFRAAADIVPAEAIYFLYEAWRPGPDPDPTKSSCLIFWPLPNASV